MTQEELKRHEAKCEETRKILPSGPWDKEPNRVNWKAHGLDCMAIRHAECFHWCGYVGVPPSHPDYGKGYDDVEGDVHGGLTYSNECDGHICHIPEDGGEDKIHWFGFDCAHCYDMSPGLEARLKQLKTQRSLEASRELQRLYEQDNARFSGTYRDLEWVKKETEKLARQLAERAA